MRWRGSIPMAASPRRLASRFKGGKLTFHLAPPLLAKRDPVTGVPRKMTFGPWMMSAFACWRSSRSCAARPSTFSAAPTSAAANGR